MTNYKFQKAIAYRIAGVGKSRIKFNLNLPNALEDLKIATNRVKVKDLMARKIITIRKTSIRKKNTKNKIKKKSRKQLWIKKVRGLRNHWSEYRIRYANKMPTENQKNAMILAGLDPDEIGTDYLTAHKKFCKIIYKLIGQNKIKNRNYLCTKLGIKYGELYKKKR